MRKMNLGGLVAAGGLLGACAGPELAVMQDESFRIEESMRPETEPPPEGIALGPDAPPLAPPDEDVLWAPVSSFPERMSEVGTNSPHYYSAPYAYPLLMPSPYCPHGGHMTTPQYNIEPRPRGSIPGLLP